MVYKAKIVFLDKLKNVPDNLRPFVSFRSELEKVTVTGEDRVAVLQIESTGSYFPVFIETKPTLKQLEAKLKNQDTELNSEARKTLLGYISEE